MSTRKKIINLPGDGEAHAVMLRVGISETITLISGNLQVTATVNKLEVAPHVVKPAEPKK